MGSGNCGLMKHSQNRTCEAFVMFVLIPLLPPCFHLDAIKSLLPSVPVSCTSHLLHHSVHNSMIKKILIF